MSLFQSMTQIQEFTLSFVPKSGGRRRRAARLRQLDAAHPDVLHERVCSRACPACWFRRHRGPVRRRCAG
ncbi:flagellar biosynthetic protein FliQ [Nocardioides convexus]|uniref:flagellar biosynthetic protein FliQ n=1 Tax=Nocardioides convexus TaxID=2712224 RepID=UPI003100C8BE